MRIYGNETLSIPHAIYKKILPVAWLFVDESFNKIMRAESMCILSKMSRFHIIDYNKPVLYTGTGILT